MIYPYSSKIKQTFYKQATKIAKLFKEATKIASSFLKVKQLGTLLVLDFQQKYKLEGDSQKKAEYKWKTAQAGR